MAGVFIRQPGGRRLVRRAGLAVGIVRIGSIEGMGRAVVPDPSRGNDIRVTRWYARVDLCLVEPKTHSGTTGCDYPTPLAGYRDHHDFHVAVPGGGFIYQPRDRFCDDIPGEYYDQPKQPDPRYTLARIAGDQHAILLPRMGQPWVWQLDHRSWQQPGQMDLERLCLLFSSLQQDGSMIWSGPINVSEESTGNSATPTSGAWK